MDTALQEPTGNDRRHQIARWVDQFEPSLLAYALRINGGDRERAEDAVQETFLRLCREDLRRVDGRIAAWLFAVCRTRVIDMQRTQQGDRVCSLPDQQTAVSNSDPADLAEWADEQQRLAAQLNRLPARQQEVLRLRLQAGLTYREIAEVTGITVSNVGVQLHQAVRTLRELLAATP